MLKVDKFGDAGFVELFDNYHKMDLATFRTYCCEKIQVCSISNQVKRDNMVIAIRSSPNKDKILKRVSDFYLAGEGHKVVT